MDSDHVDLLLAQWARQRRISTAPHGGAGAGGAHGGDRRARSERDSRECGLLGSDFDILATLRRAGEP